MMKEIGSEFWSIPIKEEDNSLFPEGTAWFESGRSALTAIIRDIKKKHGALKALLPSWCCDSMITPFLNEGIEVEFYPVYFNGGLVQEIPALSNGDILFVMDYFGYTPDSKIDNSKCIVIRDITHSVFSKVYDDADYYFGSLRKWAGFWTGGFALGIKHGDVQAANRRYVALRKNAMELKEGYISGLSDTKEYLKIFDEAEKLLETSGFRGAAYRDTVSAKKLDSGFLKEQRRANAKILLEEFYSMAIFKALQPNDCPMFVPVLVPGNKRDALRAHLAGHNIYCPFHWPISKSHALNEKTAELYNNELSLVCDQRYSEDDMRRLISVIKEF